MSLGYEVAEVRAVEVGRAVDYNSGAAEAEQVVGMSCGVVGVRIVEAEWVLDQCAEAGTGEHTAEIKRVAGLGYGVVGVRVVEVEWVVNRCVEAGTGERTAEVGQIAEVHIEARRVAEQDYEIAGAEAVQKVGLGFEDAGVRIVEVGPVDWGAEVGVGKNSARAVDQGYEVAGAHIEVKWVGDRGAEAEAEERTAEMR